jgi:hypothetical protein
VVFEEITVYDHSVYCRLSDTTLNLTMWPRLHFSI